MDHYNSETEQSAFTMTAEEADHGKRFDVFVAEKQADVSRSHMAELISDGMVTVNGRRKKPGYKLRSGDQIAGHIPPPEPVEYQPENIPLSILYEDASIIVVNKAAGMVVHPAPGHSSGTLVNALLYHFPGIETGEDVLRPGIVHRLDRETSGAIVVAKTRKAHGVLSSAFKERKVYKRYHALVYGVMEKDTGIISGHIGRHPSDRKKMAITEQNGRYAESHWQVRERFRYATSVDYEIKTGRTHQIRVHSTSIGHPLLGDATYTGNRNAVLKHCSKVAGALFKNVERQMLHAEKLEFAHPETLKLMSFKAPLPSDILALIDQMRHI